MKHLLVIAAGGALGAAARYGLSIAWPTPPGSFPWTIFAINVSGCLLIGALMALDPPPLVRLFAGTGILGGFTTFSAYALDFQGLIASGRLELAAVYLIGTLLAAVASVYIGTVVTRSALAR